MSLPVLEKDDHQYAPSDWVVHAGQALQQAGYLRSEPTGLYDEEFAAALTAFQADHGISEENQVGPYTWAALGIHEEAQEEEAVAGQEEYAVQPGDVSEDGLWQWNGSEWVAVEQTAEHDTGQDAGQPAAGGNPEDAVEVSFNDDVDDPATEEAPVPDLDDIEDIDALWQTVPQSGDQS
jgi:peptidoglycan hydrolase-like protein with peptidoglycan-binding domain